MATTADLPQGSLASSREQPCILQRCEENSTIELEMAPEVFNCDENNEVMTEPIERTDTDTAARTTTSEPSEDAAMNVAPPKQDDANDRMIRTSSLETYAGIENLGNTCYMAASLQMLASLQDSFVESVRRTSLARNGDSILLKEFIIVMDQLHEETTVHVDNLKRIVDEQSPLFVGYDQQDAHEFITTLLDLIDVECKNQLIVVENEELAAVLGIQEEVLATIDETLDFDIETRSASTNDAAQLLISEYWTDESASKRPRVGEMNETEEQEEPYSSLSLASIPFSTLDNDGISDLIYGTTHCDVFTNSSCSLLPARAPSSPLQPRCKLVGGRISMEGVKWETFQSTLPDECDISSDALNHVPHRHHIMDQDGDATTQTVTAHEGTSAITAITASSPVDANFVMTCRVQLTCDSCKFTRTHNETYSHLSLELNSSESSVQDGLLRFFAPEKLECKCEKCFAESATRSLVITTLPKCLLLHLKRFIVNVSHDYSSISYRKNRSSVAFEDVISFGGDLCLSEFMTVDGDNGVEGLQQLSMPYNLCSVVNHIGSSASCGHYTADGKRLDPGTGDLAWYRFNDDNVYGISSTSVMDASQRTAYLLMYERS